MSRPIVPSSDRLLIPSSPVVSTEGEASPVAPVEAGDLSSTRKIHRSPGTVWVPVPRRGEVSQELLERFNIHLLTPAAKVARFWKECLHPPRVEKVPYAERTGTWAYTETRADCEALLAKYETASYQSPDAEGFLKTFCKGFRETLAKLHKCLEKMDSQFMRDFPKLFDYGSSDTERRGRFERMFERLDRERAKVEGPFEELPMIFQGLAKVKEARASLSETVLEFPSIQSSGELLLPKRFEQDGLLVEQFYADYIQILHMNDLYLHRFMSSITKGFQLVDNK